MGYDPKTDSPYIRYYGIKHLCKSYFYFRGSEELNHGRVELNENGLFSSILVGELFTYEDSYSFEEVAKNALKYGLTIKKCGPEYMESKQFNGFCAIVSERDNKFIEMYNIIFILF